MAKRKRKNQRRTSRKSESIRIDFREVRKLITVAIVVIVGVWGVKKIDDVSIKTVEIQSALMNVNKNDIREIAKGYIQEGFFTVNLSRFENELNEISWVHKAKIKRQWPGKLTINIVEQVPVFRWGDDQFLNIDGEIFEAGDVSGFEELPLLRGVNGREKYLMSLYYKYQDRFDRMSASILEIEEDARYDKKIMLANNISINVGREYAEQQIERCLYSFAMFSKAERAAISSIDLRHSNGFAVRWDS